MRTRRAVQVAAAAAIAIIAPNAATATGAHRPPTTDGVIVWTNRADDGSEHLMIARANGSHQRELTPPTPDTFDIDAQVSPRGNWIAYERDTEDGASVHVIRPNGTHDHAIDVGCVEPCVAVVAPTWMSNGRLAFSLVLGPFDDETGTAAAVQMWSARLDGSGLRRISPPWIDGKYEQSYLRVAPDGSYVTFERLRLSDFHSALFRSRPGGSHVQQLTPWAISAEVNDLSTASHGPTKNLIVFESYGRGDPEQTFADIATVPSTCHSLSACTARIRWITDNAATGRRNANPQWSPDGSSLVFTNRPSVDDPNAEIWTMRYGATEADRKKISTSANFDYRPTWGNSRH
jgi:Tol biopolymer transport system component